jgi:hypothetical protein
MTDKDYNRLSEWLNEGGALTPFNQSAFDLCDISRKGEVLTFLEMTNRDLKFHRCFMSLLGYIYDLLPNKFHKQWPKQFFYRYLKHLKGNFEIIGRVENIVMIEYESIAFGKMSQKTFEEYIRLQLPWIYSDVIGKYYTVGKWRYNQKINLIETEYLKFLSKL